MSDTPVLPRRAGVFSDPRSKRWIVLASLTVLAVPVTLVGAVSVLGVVHSAFWAATCDTSCARGLPAKLDIANAPIWLAFVALLAGWVWIFTLQVRRILADPDRRVLEIAATAAVFCLFAGSLAGRFAVPGGRSS
jgi:NADH:ubiquinone oxidoreductase subunit 5 (subunit L)/multisubunit Na+/H+ antiporter MnhA subunit